MISELASVCTVECGLFASCCEVCYILIEMWNINGWNDENCKKRENRKW